MKRFLTGMFLFFALAFSLSAKEMQAPKGFAGELWKGTVALYGTSGATTHFLCTAQPIAKIAGGYRLLTAGHCAKDPSLPKDLQFSIANEISGKRTPATMFKAYLGDGLDFALFDWPTAQQIPVFQLGSESDATVGEDTVNVNFALGLGKQLSYGKVASAGLMQSEECSITDCLGMFLVQQSGGPGASGSAVFSAKSHKIIGLIVWEFRRGAVGFGVEPISWFQKFMALAIVPPPVPVTIPADIFQQRFGEAHPFTLMVHGPDPVFTQGGYVFRVESDGFELSDEYYYDVPVFIIQTEDGYRIVSTKEGFSVELTLLKAADSQ